MNDHFHVGLSPFFKVKAAGLPEPFVKQVLGPFTHVTYDYLASDGQVVTPAEIAATPNVDVLWVGHFDLTQSLGIPGQLDHPQFIQVLKLVVGAARAHGLAAAIQPGSQEQARA